MKRLSLASWAAVAGALLCSPAGAVQQAFVASSGSDGNARFNCTVVKPCRTFAAAMAVVDNGGDVVAVDAAEYGAVTITKSVSIIGNGYAAIAAEAPADAAVSIATPGVDVVLRGLHLSGRGTLAVQNGVSMTAGRSLTVEKSVISNYFAHGIFVNTAARLRIVDSTLRGNGTGTRIHGGASADVVRSQFIGNGGTGLLLIATTAGITSASVTDSVASGNATGFEAGSAHDGGIGRMLVTRSTASNNSARGFLTSASDGTAVMTVGRSTATGNGIGFAWVPGVSGVGIFESLGNNIVRHNGSDLSPFLTLVPVSSL